MLIAKPVRFHTAQPMPQPPGSGTKQIINVIDILLESSASEDEVNTALQMLGRKVYRDERNKP